MSKKELLKKLQNKQGKYTMLALDQRDSFVKAYAKTLGRKPAKKEVTELKRKIVKAIGKYPSAILIDPIYCKELAVPKGRLFCVEKSGYKEKKGERLTKLQQGFSVQKAIKLGADAIKINILYNPDASKETREHQQKIAEKIGKECSKKNIPFLLEFVVYPLGKSFEKKFPELVFETAKEFSKQKYNASILKMQFPGNLEACRKITKSIKQPWVLLTAGIPFAKFVKQLKTAKKAGCSGFLAGRAVWQDVLKIKDEKKQEQWLRTKGVKNIKALLKIMGER